MVELDKMQRANDTRLIVLLTNAGLRALAMRLRDMIAIEHHSASMAEQSSEHEAAHVRHADALESLRKLAVDTLYDLTMTHVSHTHDKVRVHLHGDFSPKRLAEILTEIQGHATAVKIQQGLLCERHAIEAVS